MQRRCLCEFDELAKSIRACQSKEQLAQVHADWKAFKSALVDLSTMAKGAYTRCEQALKRFENMREAAKKRNLETSAVAEELASKKQKTLKKQAPPVTLWGLLQSSIEGPTTMRVKNLTDKRPADLAKLMCLPVILRLPAENEIFTAVSKDLEDLQHEFGKSPERATRGQAQADLSSASCDTVANVLGNLLQDVAVPEASHGLEAKLRNWHDALASLPDAADKETTAYEASNVENQ